MGTYRMARVKRIVRPTIRLSRGGLASPPKAEFRGLVPCSYASLRTERLFLSLEPLEGIDRTIGALANLGLFPIRPWENVIRRYGIPPAPKRSLAIGRRSPRAAVCRRFRFRRTRFYLPDAVAVQIPDRAVGSVAGQAPIAVTRPSSTSSCHVLRSLPTPSKISI